MDNPESLGRQLWILCEPLPVSGRFDKRPERILQAKVSKVVGDDLQLNKNFIERPKRAGYTGRLHSNLVEPNGLTHELQIGMKDLSNFIDHQLTTTGGDKITVHDTFDYNSGVVCFVSHMQMDWIDSILLENFFHLTDTFC